MFVDHIRTSDIIKHLSKEKKTLTKLRLRLRTTWIVDEKFSPEAIPSLQSFPILLVVSLHPAFIYNDMNDAPGDDIRLIQILPPCIVLLELTDIGGTRMLARPAKGLLSLADAASQGQFPSLKRVKCYTRENLSDYGLKETLASVGVDFRHSWRFEG